MEPDNQSSVDRPLELAAEIGDQLMGMDCSIATVESCTGGGISQLLTAIAGSSKWFDRGFVTYSNDAKVEMLGVDSELIESCGAVSVEVAVAMAEGGIRFSEADYCVSVTGVAGPGGGTPEKPVGTVCFAWADLEHDTVANQAQFEGDRHSVRQQSVVYALKGLLDLVSNPG